MRIKNRILAPIRYFLGFGIIALSGLPIIMAMVLIYPFRPTRIRLANRWGRTVGPILLKLTGITIDIKGQHHLDSNRPAIYLSNHTSEADPLIAISYCPVGGCGVAKKSIVYVPFFGQIFLLSGHLRIDRKNRNRAIASMKECSQLVKNHNLSIWIWPEGSRSRTGKLLPFKKGFAHLALSTRLPIVPIVVKGAYELWPPKSFVIKPGQASVTALDPIDTTEWKLESLAEHIAAVEAVYRDALNAIAE